MNSEGCEVCGLSECEDANACLGALVYQQHPDAVLERKYVELLTTGHTTFEITLNKPLKVISGRFKVE